MVAEKDHSYTRRTLRETRMRSAKLGCEVRSDHAKLQDAKSQVILIRISHPIASHASFALRILASHASFAS